MKTLKEQLPESINCGIYTEEVNQTCEIIERKILKNTNDYDDELILVNFINESKSPVRISGYYVVVIEHHWWCNEYEIVDINKYYVKQIFNK